MSDHILATIHDAAVTMDEEGFAVQSSRLHRTHADVLALLAEVERLRKIEEAASELVAVIPVTYTEATNQQIWERAYSLREILRASSYKSSDE